MAFAYVSVEEAIKRRGLRMVVVGDVPSPWGEAAKGILHIKRIDWVAVRLAYDSEPLAAPRREAQADRSKQAPSTQSTPVDLKAVPDDQRAVEFLQNRREVDPDRVAVVGVPTSLSDGKMYPERSPPSPSTKRHRPPSCAVTHPCTPPAEGFASPSAPWKSCT